MTVEVLPPDIGEEEGRAAKRPRCEGAWKRSFERSEIWVLNTEYRLFNVHGPKVNKAGTFLGRLDEMCKCLGAAPGTAALRLFWADATVSIEGPDLGDWQHFVGKKAPSEQQMAAFLLPNIEAAWRGETRTRTIEEAKEIWYTYGSLEEPAPACPERGGQPTPGVFVAKSSPIEGEEWRMPWQDDADWSTHHWPTRPTREAATRFLAAARTNRLNHVDLSEEPSEAAMGVLLEYSGADIRFLSQAPLTRPSAGRPDPSACITVLGGPKGISATFQEVIREVFAAATVPLVEICLGPREEMAHACVAFLRIQEDAGLHRAALVDLLRKGKAGYTALMDRVTKAAAAAAEEAEEKEPIPAVPLALAPGQ